ncbi:MAG: twitching motility protein PilT [Thermoplasmata archaeon]|jgi:rRNA-processing protein FCF1|nr:twitching motility protein PilT [Thermoplasmata archaeon]MVT15347.1 twitching motility protein PilT [Euryarchaeota archaeon]MVT35279.1 twitching motility protein PilT [Euryarchaeota archaeon]
MDNEVIVDTNALLLPFQSGLDIEKNLEELLGKYIIIVPDSVIRELEKLSTGNPQARAALSYSKRFKIVKTDLEGDESIVSMAEKRKSYVLTNDYNLIKILKKKGIKVIRPRGKKRLEII